MWLNEGSDFTEQASEVGQIDVSMEDPAAELLALLDDDHWSDFFEVVPRTDLGLLLVRRRNRYHSTTEELFWDALWSLIRLHDTGGLAPLDDAATTRFFEMLVTDLRQRQDP
jgi:hypothetical protein